MAAGGDATAGGNATVAGDSAEGQPADSGPDANAALNLGLSISVVVGPLLAAVAVEAFGVPVAMLIDAASFLVCGALLIDLYPYVEEHTGTSVRARLGAAWEHLREAPALRALLLTEAAALIFFETGAPAEVLYAKGTLKAGDLGYGRLLSAWGVGMVLGSLIFARCEQALARRDADRRDVRGRPRLRRLRGGAVARAGGGRGGGRRDRQRHAVGLVASAPCSG